MAKVPAKEKIGKGVGKPDPPPEEEKEKSKRAEKADFPTPEGGHVEWPTAFDGKKDKPLKRKDFKDESVWLVHRADELEKRAKDYRTQAENYKKLGSVKDKAKAKKLITMMGKMAELRAQLEADGVNVDELLPKPEIAETAKDEAASE